MTGGATRSPSSAISGAYAYAASIAGPASGVSAGRSVNRAGGTKPPVQPRGEPISVPSPLPLTITRKQFNTPPRHCADTTYSLSRAGHSVVPSSHSSTVGASSSKITFPPTSTPNSAEATVAPPPLQYQHHRPQRSDNDDHGKCPILVVSTSAFGHIRHHLVRTKARCVTNDDRDRRISAGLCVPTSRPSTTRSIGDTTRNRKIR